MEKNNQQLPFIDFDRFLPIDSNKDVFEFLQEMGAKFIELYWKKGNESSIITDINKVMRNNPLNLMYSDSEKIEDLCTWVQSDSGREFMIQPQFGLKGQNGIILLNYAAFQENLSNFEPFYLSTGFFKTEAYSALLKRKFYMELPHDTKMHEEFKKIDNFEKGDIMKGYKAYQESLQDLSVRKISASDELPKYNVQRFKGGFKFQYMHLQLTK